MRKYRLTGNRLGNIILGGVRRAISETRLDYDEDNFGGRHAKSEDYDDYVDPEGYLDDPNDRDDIEYGVRENRLRHLVREAVDDVLSSIRDPFSPKNTAEQRHALKYETAVDLIDHYMWMVHDGEGLTRGQCEQIGEAVDFLRQTDTGDNPEAREWIKRGTELLSGFGVSRIGKRNPNYESVNRHMRATRVKNFVTESSDEFGAEWTKRFNRLTHVFRKIFFDARDAVEDMSKNHFHYSNIISEVSPVTNQGGKLTFSFIIKSRPLIHAVYNIYERIFGGIRPFIYADYDDTANGVIARISFNPKHMASTRMTQMDNGWIDDEEADQPKFAPIN